MRRGGEKGIGEESTAGEDRVDGAREKERERERDETGKARGRHLGPAYMQFGEF